MKSYGAPAGLAQLIGRPDLVGALHREVEVGLCKLQPLRIARRQIPARSVRFHSGAGHHPPRACGLGGGTHSLPRKAAAMPPSKCHCQTSSLMQ